MSELTLESLARRVEALERALAVKPPVAGQDAWHSVVGMFAGSDFMREVDEEGERSAERSARARQEPAVE